MAALGGFHRIGETFEQAETILRARAGLGVVLDGKDGLALQADAAV